MALLPIKSIAESFAARQGAIFEASLQRSQLQIKLALSIRLEKDLAAVEDKFDGAKEDGIEAQINKLSDKKESIAIMASNLKNALAKFNDIREFLLTMRDHAGNGFGPSFDTQHDALNDKVGSAVLDKQNLIGNIGYAGLTSQRDFISLGVTSTTVEHSFLGTDYSIELADTSVVRPDFEALTLDGTSFSSLTLTSLVGDAIAYSDGVTAFTGTLTRTGTSIMSAWMYNDFAAQADIDSAQADIDTAMKTILTLEESYRRNLTAIEANVSSLDSTLQTLADDFSRVSLEELDAKQAERRAITERFDLTVNAFALTSNISLGFIQSLFLAPDINEKTSVFQILRGPIG